jgi:hypothetical protein
MDRMQQRQFNQQRRQFDRLRHEFSGDWLEI